MAPLIGLMDIQSGVGVVFVSKVSSCVGTWNKHGGRTKRIATILSKCRLEPLRMVGYPGHVDAPMQVRHYFLRSIAQLEQPIDGFFELLTSAGPQIPTQIVEPVVNLEDRATDR